MSNTDFIMFATELMAWCDDNWTGNALNIVREAVNGASPQIVEDMVCAAFAEYVSGYGIENIVPEDMMDRFSNDDEYQEFIEWAGSL